MKIRDGFILRTIADTHIVVPVADRVIEFKGMITLNDVSVEIWNFLQIDRSYDDVLEYMLSIYEIDRETAANDLNELLDQMVNGGVLEK